MDKKKQVIELLEKYSNETDMFKPFITRDEFVDLAEEIVKLFAIPAVIKSLPDSDEIRMKARELDEKDFAQWMYELQKGNVL